MEQKQPIKEKRKITEKDIERYTLEAKEKIIKRGLYLDPKLFKPKNIDLSKAEYEVDAIQNELLKFYLSNDIRFRKAFYTNFTPIFLKFLYDKVKFKEPIHLSTMGYVRSGKSYAMITLICLCNALYGRKTTIDYISGNQYEFLQKLQRMPQDMLLDSMHLCDEDKGAVFSAGSVAKKMKLQDVQNIIAINNISTITINPTKFTNTEAFYGLRAFGKCQKTKTVRFMLYNLQESANTHLPMGMIYLPIFTEVVPYWRELEKEYLLKKKIWVEQEQRGEGDILFELKKREAVLFAKNPKFRNIKHKKDKLTFIGLTLGSEWTEKECEEILSMTELINQGAISTDDGESKKVSIEELRKREEAEPDEEEIEEKEAKVEEEALEKEEKEFEKEKEEFEAK